MKAKVCTRWSCVEYVLIGKKQKAYGIRVSSYIHIGHVICVQSTVISNFIELISKYTCSFARYQSII